MSANAADTGSGGGGGVGVSSGGGGGGSMDWICGDSDCRHVNFARRTQCNKCQREHSPERSSSSGVGSSGTTKKKLGTEIGKAAAEKSRGLFSAEDWQCSKCANVNWARRQTCNMCNAPKFCEVEERTGFGGGYNDRGVVEYKERSESDSEYDEFGRLKKRKKEPNISREKKSNVSGGEEDEDEDDEDGEDGDLSKYDLWGDDEVTENKSKSDLSPKATIKPENNKRISSSPKSFSSSSSSSYTSTSTSSSATSSRSSSSSSRSSRSRSHHRQRSLSKEKNKRINNLKTMEPRQQHERNTRSHSYSSSSSKSAKRKIARREINTNSRRTRSRSRENSRNSNYRRR